MTPLDRRPQCRRACTNRHCSTFMRPNHAPLVGNYFFWLYSPSRCDFSSSTLLVRPAMFAVEQWQYRPYLLNHEPVVVQSQITVNFVLNRN